MVTAPRERFWERRSKRLEVRLDPALAALGIPRIPGGFRFGRALKQSVPVLERPNGTETLVTLCVNFRCRLRAICPYGTSTPDFS